MSMIIPHHSLGGCAARPAIGEAPRWRRLIVRRAWLLAVVLGLLVPAVAIPRPASADFGDVAYYTGHVRIGGGYADEGTKIQFLVITGPSQYVECGTTTVTGEHTEWFGHPHDDKRLIGTYIMPIDLSQPLCYQPPGFTNANQTGRRFTVSVNGIYVTSNYVTTFPRPGQWANMDLDVSRAAVASPNNDALGWGGELMYYDGTVSNGLLPWLPTGTSIKVQVVGADCSGETTTQQLFWQPADWPRWNPTGQVEVINYYLVALKGAGCLNVPRNPDNSPPEVEFYVNGVRRSRGVYAPHFTNYVPSRNPFVQALNPIVQVENPGGPLLSQEGRVETHDIYYSENNPPLPPSRWE